MNKERKNQRLKAAPDDKIDNFSYEIVRTLYPETGDGALLTNKSTLEDFEEQSDIPGHELRRLSNVPKAERKYYLNDFKTVKHFLGFTAERYMVWYPPVTKTEWEQIERETRHSLIGRLEKIYCISFTDYPTEEELYVWKVAEYITRQKGKEFGK